MLSRARSSGPSGPLPPRERSTRQSDPLTSGPLGPDSRELIPPEPGRSRGLPPAPPASVLGGLVNEPTPVPGSNKRRWIGPPREHTRHGGGLLSFARAASSTMRAIITGKRQALRPERPAAMLEGAPAGFPGEEPPRPPRRYEPYKRSRVRLVIHKRLERRQVRGQKLLISGIVTSFLLLLAVGLSLYGGSNVYAFYTSTQTYLGALANPNGFPLTTRIYDRNGVLLYAMLVNPLGPPDPNAAYRYYDQYAQIPQNLKNATVDIEDKTFWTNSGVDLLGILRAGINNVSSSGGGTQGGSTITQQLIKNAFFVDPKTGVAAETPQRKIQEALMAYAVTNKYSKADLLEFYLNIIPYGYLSRGIEAAAQNMFSIAPTIDPKTHQYVTAAQQLDLAQAALLAGLPRDPTGTSPCGGDANTLKDRRTAALNRMHDVLNAMLTVHDITQAQWNQADAESDMKDTGAKFFRCRSFDNQEKAPHFVDYVINQLAQMLAPNGDAVTGEEILAHAGLNVYTTLDYRLESYVEQDTYQHIYVGYTVPGSTRQYAPLSAPASQGGYNIHDAAVVVIDPRDGDILAMNGSGDYNDNHGDIREGGSYNGATAYRQPGSSFKPSRFAALFQVALDRRNGHLKGRRNLGLAMALIHCAFDPLA